MEKSTLTNCKECPLFNQPMVIGETNCESDLSLVRLLVLAEAPSHSEIKLNRPLVGKTGSLFRTVFEELSLNKIPYFISNVVLCSNIQDGKTNNPPKEAFELCKNNWKKIIELTNPDLILIMGNTVIESLGLESIGVSKMRGNIYKFEDKYDVLVTFHPSYVHRNGGLEHEDGQKFISDLRKIREILLGEKIEQKEVAKKSEKVNKPFSFKLPDWCYSKDLCLINIQNCRLDNTILFTFSNKNGEKKYYNTPNRNYYYYIDPTKTILESDMVTKIDGKHLVQGRPPFEDNTSAFFEGDVRTELKHSVDYSFNKKEEDSVHLKIMYFDIEVFSDGERSFPDARLAERPINAISFKLDDGTLYVLLNKISKMDSSKLNDFPGCKIVPFNSEKELLNGFCSAIRKLEPMVIAGWNIKYFDIPTILNRMVKLGMDVNDISPVHKVLHDNERIGKSCIYGIYIADMLELYKEFTYSVEPSYKLSSISEKILGHGKVAYEGTLDGVYTNDINKFIEYSLVDTNLLYELESKLGHIELRYELSKICSSTLENSEYTSGLLDPLILSYAKNNNLICRNSLKVPTMEKTVKKSKDDSIPGAFVKHPKKGLHKYIVDFDFSSLYPSIICSCNIGPNTYIGKIEDIPSNRIVFNEMEDSKTYFNKIAYNWIYNKEKITGTINVELDPLKPSSKMTSFTKEEFQNWIDDNEAIITVAGTIFKGHNKEISFFNEIERKLLSSRKEYSKMAGKMKSKKNMEEYKKYDCIQLAYKILANAMYGILLKSHFRMFNLDMAKSITLTGQEIIKFSGEHLGKYMESEDTSINKNFIYGYEDRSIPYVIYQDTDSIFVGMGEYIQKKGINV